MAQTSKKTNNSYLADKVALRVAHMPKAGEVRVLDCYAGQGVIWRAVERLTGREIKVLGIDVNKPDELSGFRMPGDNRAYLEIIDLSRFDVVDLDAYGIP